MNLYLFTSNDSSAEQYFNEYPYKFNLAVLGVNLIDSKINNEKGTQFLRQSMNSLKADEDVFIEGKRTVMREDETGINHVSPTRSDIIKRCTFIICFFLIYFSSCNTQKETKDDVLRISLQEAEKRTNFNTSDVFSSIEYVALETTSQCLIGEIVYISVSEKFILAFNCYNNPSCHLFSREGKYIRSIGQRGNGPQDYLDNSYRVKIDEKSEMIYLLGLFEICVYNLSGKFIKKLNLLELEKAISVRTQNIMHWKDNLFCANIDLNSGKAPYRCIIFTLDGEIVKLFPNHIFFDTGKSGGVVRSTLNSDANIYCYNEQLFFKERLCDTLFRITEQLELVPEIIFDLPGKKMPTEMRGSFSQPVSDYMITGIYEVEKYLFITSSKEFRQCLYDKHKKQLISFDSDPLLKVEIVAPLPGGANSSRTGNLSGFRNDIDGGLPFRPLINIQNNKQMACVYQSYLLKELLTEEHFARYEVKDREAHKRLRSLLANLDEEDNPVIMIATFK